MTCCLFTSASVQSRSSGFLSIIQGRARLHCIKWADKKTKFYNIILSCFRPRVEFWSILANLFFIHLSFHWYFFCNKRFLPWLDWLIVEQWLERCSLMAAVSDWKKILLLGHWTEKEQQDYEWTNIRWLRLQTETP